MILTENEVIPYLEEVQDIEKLKFLIQHSHQLCFDYEVVIRTSAGNEVVFLNFAETIKYYKEYV